MSQLTVFRGARGLGMVGLLAGLLAQAPAQAQTVAETAPVARRGAAGACVAMHVLSPEAKRAAEALFGRAETAEQSSAGQQPAAQQEGPQIPATDQPDSPETASQLQVEQR